MTGTATACLACTLWLCSTACTPSEPLARSAAPIIYGTDDRVEAALASEAFDVISRNGVAALIPAPALRGNGTGKLEIVSPTLSEVFGLCEDERFAAQPCAALCSAVLIDERHVLTAGHCVPQGQCGAWKIVFGYRYDAEGVLQVSEREVFDCRSVTAWRNDSLTDAGGLDYAVLELNRPVTDPLAPIPLLRGAPPTDGLALVGTSQGLPLKVDERATLFESLTAAGSSLRLRADSFGGDSGAPLVTGDRRLLGIVVGGEPDYIQHDGEDCQRNRLADADMTMRGEIVTLVQDAQSDWCRGITEGSVDCFDAHACDEQCIVVAPDTSQSSSANSCSFAPVPVGPGSWTAGIVVACVLRARRRRLERAERNQGGEQHRD